MLILVPQTNGYTLVWVLLPLAVYYLHSPIWARGFYLAILVVSWAPLFGDYASITQLALPVMTGLFGLAFAREPDHEQIPSTCMKW
jgi:hypothetical protein